MDVPEVVVVALAPVAELLVPRTAVDVLGQPEVLGGRRTVAVAGENILERAFVFNGVYIPESGAFHVRNAVQQAD